MLQPLSVPGDHAERNLPGRALTMHGHLAAGRVGTGRREEVGVRNERRRCGGGGEGHGGGPFSWGTESSAPADGELLRGRPGQGQVITTCECSLLITRPGGSSLAGVAAG